MLEHVTFWWEEFDSMVGKGKLVVLPYLVAKDLPVLRLFLSGVKEYRERRPRQLGNNIFSNIHCETSTIYALYAMQYVQALERLIREVVIANP